MASIDEDLKKELTWMEQGYDETSTEWGNHKNHSAMFADPKKMKEEMKENIKKIRYDVSMYYWEEGIAQSIATAQIFENITLGVIAINACWISIDTDYNNASQLVDADLVFLLAENFFCVYFTFEWTVRFLSFKYKGNCMKDAWFVFDSFMVFVMVMETWVLFTMMKLSGSSDGANTGMLKLLRLLRLSRMARMARLLRTMPELLILIRGMVKAMRSVGFTLILLSLIIYVFAIYFKQMSADTILADKYFPNIPTAFRKLLLYGVLLDSCGAMSMDIAEEVDGPVMLFIGWLAFIMLGALTVMNMLIGVLCEVIAAVAEVETEEINISYMHDQFEDIISHAGELPRDEDDNIMISKPTFNDLIQKPEVAQLLDDMHVDCLGLVDLIDILFYSDDGSEKMLSFSELLCVMLDHRSTSAAAVKDVTDMRKFCQARFSKIMDTVGQCQSQGKVDAIVLESDLSVLGDILETPAGFATGYFQETWQKNYAEEKAAADAAAEAASKQKQKVKEALKLPMNDAAAIESRGLQMDESKRETSDEVSGKKQKSEKANRKSSEEDDGSDASPQSKEKKKKKKEKSKSSVDEPKDSKEDESQDVL